MPHSTPTSPPHSSLSATGPSRRQVLLAGAAALGSTALGSTPARAAVPRSPGDVSGVFTLGVASGDPLPDGVVLWTRLAPEPLAADGRGGMPEVAVPVAWQVATDERFTRVVRSGTETAHPAYAHAVHAEVSGLRPGAEYFYRFRAGGELSPVGRTKTAPAAGSRLDRFAFAFASCQNYPDGYFNAYAQMAEEDLDLVAFLGDYIYEGDSQGSIGRGHLPAKEAWSLADYRVRHAQYRSDPDLQAVHAAFPWAVVFDDHEVDDNWADDVSKKDGEPDQSPRVFLRRRARAFRAYYEHLPLRRAQRPNGPDMQLYRRLGFGDLMDFYLLDTRQYRDDQVPDAHRADPDRTILGERQKAWLERQVAGPTGRWNVLAQQVFFSQRDLARGSATQCSDDAWDDYEVERNSIRDHLAAAGTPNPVVITGDVHANYVCDILADFDHPSSATVGTELVGTSVSSGGDGSDSVPDDATQLAENPHIKFIDNNRGYVRNVVTRDAWTADFRVVDYVSRRGAPVRTRASFVVENGRPGAQRA